MNDDTNSLAPIDALFSERTAYPTALELSEMLGSLYQAARTDDVVALRARAVQMLRKHVKFDGAIVGAATFVHAETHIHDAYVWNLSDEMVHLVNLTQQGFMNQSAIHHPGQAFLFGPAQYRDYPEQAALLRRAGMEQVIAVALVHDVSHLVNFVSFARTAGQAAFDLKDAQWLELLLPHFETVHDISRLASLVRHPMRVEQQPLLTAATDSKGILYVAEPGFDELLRREWPNWHGPYLPVELLDALSLNRSRYMGEYILIDMDWLDKQVVLNVGLRSCVDMLSHQEHAVAKLYSAGRSYKEVAQELRIAPATVRHHLRSIYIKLGVDDKAALAQRLARPVM